MQTTKRATILSASAGSGKTFSLVLRYICDIIKSPDRYRNILAVTFTNKATEEMKSRIIKEIHLLASNQESEYLEGIIEATGYSEPQIRTAALKARTKILHDYSRFTVLTIDRFFQRILRAFINEMSLDLNYNIELDTGLLLERSADRLIESIANNDEMHQWLQEFAEELLDDGHKWDMRKNLCSLGNEIFKSDIAKNQSTNISKERLHQIVNELIKESTNVKQKIQELSIEALKYIDDRGIRIEDFKGAGGTTNVVRAFTKYTDGSLSAPTDNMIAASTDLNKWYDAKKHNATIKAAAEHLMPIMGEICRLYAENINRINTSQLLRKNYRSYALLADLYQQVDTICKEDNVMILDTTKDLLSKFVDESNAPFIYEKVGSRYDHYMIDEFQDTSVREWRNIRPLLLEALSSNPESSVFIVGDIKQSIYRWRGGHWRLLKSGVVDDLGKENTDIITPEENYRSLENVVKFNNETINKVAEFDNNHLNNLLDKALQNDKISQQTHAEYYNIMSVAYQNSRQVAKKKSSEGGYAEVTVYDPKVVQAPFITAIESAISRGYRYSDILILVRGNSDGRKATEALYNYKRERFTAKGEVGFNILTSDSLTIGSCDIVEFIIAVLRISADRHNDIERGVYNRFMQLPYEHRFDEHEHQVFDRIAHLSPLEAFELIVEEFKLYEHKSRIAYLQAIHEQILSFTRTRGNDIQQYLEWWSEQGYKESLMVEMSDDTIEISTIHKAKGLERAVVIVPQTNWSLTPMALKLPIVWSKARGERNNDLLELGKFPITYGKSMAESAFSEEYYKELAMSHIDGVNLLYVAQTRAAKELYMYVPHTLTDSKSKKPVELGEPSASLSDISSLVICAAKKFCGEPTKEYSSDVLAMVKYSHGKPIERYNPEAEKKKDSIETALLEDYTTHTPKVSVRYFGSRYIEEGLTPGSEACRNGILLHRIFESAITTDDLHRAIERLAKDSLIEQRDVERLRHNIVQALKDKRVEEWFSNTWDDVRTETDIVSNANDRRPDRVMIAGNRAVVVDYKFGFKRDISYNNQVKEYVALLKDMKRYDTIEGYVWYINLGHIEDVNNPNMQAELNFD